MVNRVQVLYQCGRWHPQRVDLARGSICPDEECDALPVKVNTHEWRVRCPDCRYGRWCGQSAGDALRKQTTHIKANPTHAPSVAYDKVTLDGRGTVLVWDGKRVRRTTPVVHSRGTAESDQDPAPF